MVILCNKPQNSINTSEFLQLSNTITYNINKLYSYSSSPSSSVSEISMNISNRNISYITSVPSPSSFKVPISNPSPSSFNVPISNPAPSIINSQNTTSNNLLYWLIPTILIVIVIITIIIIKINNNKKRRVHCSIIKTKNITNYSNKTKSKYKLNSVKKNIVRSNSFPKISTKTFSSLSSNKIKDKIIIRSHSFPSLIDYDSPELIPDNYSSSLDDLI